MTTKEELAEKLTGIFENSIQQMVEIIEDYTESKKTDEVINPDYGLWKPELDEKFYFINFVGIINSAYFRNSSTDRYILSIGNCFKTQEDAEKHLEHLKVETQLRDIAVWLNKGREIDWNNNAVNKYYISYSYCMDEIEQRCSIEVKRQGIYCLDENFKDAAIAEIGEERLEEYLKNG